MKEIAQMRLGVLRELKNVRVLLDRMERKVKSRDPVAIEQGYMFLKTLVVMLDIGELSPDSVAVNLELAKAFQKEMNDE